MICFRDIRAQTPRCLGEALPHSAWHRWVGAVGVQPGEIVGNANAITVDHALPVAQIPELVCCSVEDRYAICAFSVGVLSLDASANSRQLSDV